MGNLSLDSIRTDGGTQARSETAAVTVAEYTDAMREGTVFPAVVVFYDGTDHWLADGFHRVAAAKAAGRTEVSAEIRKGTRRDAVLHAAGANATHGLRRTNADKRRAVEVLLRDDEWATWSDRKIAKACGVTHPFVAKVRAGEVVMVTTATGTFPVIEPGKGYVGVDGELVAMIQHWVDEDFCWVSVLTLPEGADGGTIVESKKPVRVEGIPGMLDQFGFPNWNKVTWHPAEYPPAETPITGGVTWRRS